MSFHVAPLLSEITPRYRTPPVVYKLAAGWPRSYHILTRQIIINYDFNHDAHYSN